MGKGEPLDMTGRPDTTLGNVAKTVYPNKSYSLNRVDPLLIRPELWGALKGVYLGRLGELFLHNPW